MSNNTFILPKWPLQGVMIMVEITWPFRTVHGNRLTKRSVGRFIHTKKKFRQARVNGGNNCECLKGSSSQMPRQSSKLVTRMNGISTAFPLSLLAKRRRRGSHSQGERQRRRRPYGANQSADWDFPIIVKFSNWSQGHRLSFKLCWFRIFLQALNSSNLNSNAVLSIYYSINIKCAWCFSSTDFKMQ